MLDLHYLQIFDKVASLESFTKASKELHISQSALSIQIKRFEEELGIKLFNRIGNKITLNENGKLLYEYSRNIFKIVTQAEYKLLSNREYITGTINIGASNTPGTYIFPNIIAQYRKLYPDVKINLTIGNTTEITHLINNGTLDFAVNSVDTNYHNDAVLERIYTDRLILVACPQSKYARYDAIGVEELKDMAFVLHKTESQLYKAYRKFMEDRGLPENTCITVGNIDAIKRAIMADVGVSLIPSVSVELELKAGYLVKLPLDGDEMLYPYYLVYNRNRYIPVAGEKFIALLRDYIKQMEARE